ncbi:MAG: glucan biosynthesis protein G [Hyphomicrobium sp.]|nr:glucan biosynthesis protein G [Hyphomicrobium sp.]
MTIEKIDRRSVLGTSVSMAAAVAFVRALGASGQALAGETAPAAAPADPTAAAAVAPPAFTAAKVLEAAMALAAADFVKPVIDLPEPFNKLSYDQYRDIRFRTDHAVWHGEKVDFEIQLFPMGWLYETPVDIYVVDQGDAKKLVADGKLFALGPLIGQGPEAAPFGFSGFRVHGPINRADYFDEYLVFQGASYLRAVGRGQNYGASARGLAINTARPGGEEFPFFRTFWIEKPKAGTPEIVVHGLLDSPSTTGAYRFVIQPGAATVMDIEATLFTRKQIPHVGIAPLTSMFLHGPADQRPSRDFRPEVHDSEGLALWNGGGELIWRPLVNPKTLQISAFMDKDPKGFGLWQRGRSFPDFQDLEARYERRPSVWVEPKGAWGEGFIELVEIPVEDEIHDNVAVYWKPAKGLEAGKSHKFDYRLHWADNVPAAWSGARVAKTRIGAGKKPETFLFVIDFEGPAVKELRDLPVAELTANQGSVANVVVQRNPDISGIRVSFEMSPGGTELVELRLVLKAAEQAISESWLYRWTKL